MIFNVKPKRKILNRINRLIRFLYRFTIRQSGKNSLTNNEMFALIMFDEKVRKATEELMDKFGKTKMENFTCVQTGLPCGFPCFYGCPEYKKCEIKNTL